METPRLGSRVDPCPLLPDPRIDRTKRHLLLDSVVMAVCAVIGGAGTWVDLAEYGRAKYEWLKRFLPLPHGMPSHDTLARVFARLHPDAFRTCVLGWLEGLREQTGGQVGGEGMAIDGKTSRHRVDRAIGRSPLHLVSAWATETGLVWRQVAVEEQSQEITAIPELLTALEWAGCLVTIDAMGTQQEMAKTLVEQEADDVLALNSHQGTLSADVEWFFQWADEQQDRGIAHGTHETQTTGHGRVERRCTTVTDAIDWLQGRRDWVGLQTIVMVEAWRTQGHETSSERRYDISRVGPDAQQIGERVQRHWTIENSLHGVLDIAFHEDDSPIRKGHAPEHFAMLRHIAVNLLKQERTNYHGVQAKRNRAGWDHAYLLTVLGM